LFTLSPLAAAYCIHLLQKSNQINTKISISTGIKHTAQRRGNASDNNGLLSEFFVLRKQICGQEECSIDDNQVKSGMFSKIVELWITGTNTHRGGV
jgi:hypothetical protein